MTPKITLFVTKMNWEKILLVYNRAMSKSNFFKLQMSLCSCTACFSFLLQMLVLFGDIRGWTSASIYKCHQLLLAQAFHVFSDLESRVHHVIPAGKRRRGREERHRNMGLEGEPCPKNLKVKRR